MLRHLIDEGVEPKNIEYIVVHDTEVYGPGSKVIGIIKAGSIAINVTSKKAEDGFHLGYDYELKESGEKHHTNYVWALAENTPENIIILKEYYKKRKEYFESKKELEKAQLKIVTLKNK